MGAPHLRAPRLYSDKEPPIAACSVPARDCHAPFSRRASACAGEPPTVTLLCVTDLPSPSPLCLLHRPLPLRPYPTCARRANGGGDGRRLPSHRQLLLCRLPSLTTGRVGLPARCSAGELTCTSPAASPLPFRRPRSRAPAPAAGCRAGPRELAAPPRSSPARPRAGRRRRQSCADPRPPAR